MDIVVDTSALVAVILGEPERERIIELTARHTLIGPGSIPWEVGNAFSAILKQDRLTIDDAQKGLAIFEQIPIQFVDIALGEALELSARYNIYAYDAYLIQCALKRKSPLLTLDQDLCRAAQSAGAAVIEVER